MAPAGSEDHSGISPFFAEDVQERFSPINLVPCFVKSAKLPLRATYQDSNVYDGCHLIFDKFSGADVNVDRGTRARGTVSPT